MPLHLKSLFASLSSALVIAVFCCGITPAMAQTAGSAAHGKSTAIPEKTPDGTWESLKPAQQQILNPLKDDWDYMLPDSRKKWTQVANIYPKMSEQDQQRLQSRMASWSNLSQKERRIARENYLSSLKFPAEKKAEAWSAYQKLSDEQKKKLAGVEAKKKPKAVNAPTLQQHAINPQTTPPPPAPKPRSMTTEGAPPASDTGSAY
ncbi:DUF3106 domain-containing protein [Polynucleobacter sp. MWH-Creno-3A4]|uniref:DUF3106 domain-containing protein n=1 Tax=Polynucleobacter sp. MWH-Creno-3A4 TaxID=1855886 RepID=UPI001C0B72E7|nr:DUF3106 domain-containing protein [Polynucleobacter sp. MWH-Creno-3A4]MBU3606614.1 DUF3106 domain-containing protein [Polynucleobacter sp. MWH-Creno-3A4]